jgi:hypothetical protein
MIRNCILRVDSESVADECDPSAKVAPNSVLRISQWNGKAKSKIIY